MRCSKAIGCGLHRRLGVIVGAAAKDRARSWPGEDKLLRAPAERLKAPSDLNPVSCFVASRLLCDCSTVMFSVPFNGRGNDRHTARTELRQRRSNVGAVHQHGMINLQEKKIKIKLRSKHAIHLTYEVAIRNAGYPLKLERCNPDGDRSTIEYQEVVDKKHLGRLARDTAYRSCMLPPGQTAGRSSVAHLGT